MHNALNNALQAGPKIVWLLMNVDHGQAKKTRGSLQPGLFFGSPSKNLVANFSETLLPSYSLYYLVPFYITIKRETNKQILVTQK